MDDELKNTFCDYVKKVHSEIKKPWNNERVKKHFSLIEGDSVKINNCENSDEFKKLVSLTKLNFYSSWPDFIIKNATKNFFRRSSCYLNIIKNRVTSIDGLYKQYVSEFKKKTTTKMYLIPMYLVHINADTVDIELDFGSFKIKRFTAKQLETLLSNEINQIFYPYAYFDSLDNLMWLPFICITESVANRLYNPTNLEQFDIAEYKFSGFPKCVNDALKKLALISWEDSIHFDPRSFRNIPKNTELNKRYWQGFEIPFMIQINHSLLKSPIKKPDFSNMRFEPAFDDENRIMYYMPFSIFTFDDEEFKNTIKTIGEYFLPDKEYSEKWPFVENALNFFLKAFASQGVEQLLWHTVVIEALLGAEKNITDLVAKRISKITNEPKNKKKYKNLYIIRSKLVHGDKPSKPINIGNLYQARLITKEVLIWFLKTTKNISEQLHKNKRNYIIPTRDEILNYIDLGYEGRNKLLNVMKLLESKNQKK